LIGEVRRGEALDLIQSMISGHTGSLTTVHASTPQDAASRLETMCLSSDTSLPIYVARAQVASALHLVVQIERLRGGQRLVTSVSECLGLDDQQRFQWSELYRYSVPSDEAGQAEAGALMWTGRQSQFSEIVRTRGLARHVRRTHHLFAARLESTDSRSGSAQVTQSTLRRADPAAVQVAIH
jgi:pilus assembly protein CpaF